MKLLLLHPLPLDGSIFADDLRSLGDVCVAPTLYGAGDDIGTWADAALAAVGEGPLVVVGNSVGGSCAIEVAYNAPSRVRALVLCGAKAGHRPEPALRDEALRVLADDGAGAAWDRYWRPLFGPHAAADLVDRARSTAVAIGAPALAAGVRAFHGRPDRSDFVDAWPGRVHVVAGEYDTAPAIERQRADAARMRATFHVIAGVGHYVPIEAPGELAAIVATAIDDVA